MRSSLVTGTLVWLACLALAGPASAQQQSTITDTALRRLGPLWVNPGLVFSSGYDTNPYREKGAEPDVETYAIPQIDSRLDVGRLANNLFGAVELVTFANRNGARNYQYGTRSEWQGGVLRPYLNYTSKHTNANPTGFEVGRKSMRNENDIKAGMNTQVSGRLFVNGFYRRTVTDWDADAIYQSSSLREKLNRTDTAYGGGVEIALTPLTSVRFSAETIDNQFRFSPIRDGSGYRYGPGLSIIGPAAINANVDIGIRSFTSKSSDVTFRGLYSNTTITKAFPTGTFAAFRWDRDIQFSYDTSLAYFLGTALEVKVIQPLGEKWGVQAFFANNTIAYDRVTEGLPPVDGVKEAGFAIGRSLTRLIRVGVTVEWASASGSQPWTETRTVGFMNVGLGAFQRLDRPIPFQR